jgi:hypothetical protein
MDALPAWAAGSSSLLKLLNQPWEGDVTMVLPVRGAGRAHTRAAATRAALLRSAFAPVHAELRCTMLCQVTTLSTAKSVINLSPQDVTVAMQEASPLSMLI